MKKLLFYTILLLISFSESKAQTSDWRLSFSSGFGIISSGSDISSTTVCPTIEFSYFFTNRFYIGADLGLSIITLKREGFAEKSRFDFANPVLKAGIPVNNVSRQLDMEFEIQVGIPLAVFPGNIPDNRLSEFNYINAGSINGWRSPLMWMMNVIPFAIGGKVRLKQIEALELNMGLSPLAFVSINSRPSKVGINSTLELILKTGYANIRTGASLFSLSSSLENNDFSQTSVFVGTDLSIGGELLKLDLNINLDLPYGIEAGKTKPFWGVIIKY